MFQTTLRVRVCNLPRLRHILSEACQDQQPSLREIVWAQYSNKQHHIKTSNSVLRIGSKLAAACIAFSKSFMTDLQVLYIRKVYNTFISTLDPPSLAKGDDTVHYSFWKKRIVALA